MKTRKIISLFLAAVMVFSMVQIVLPVSIMADTTVTRISDPSTLDSWKDLFGKSIGNTENAGVVWSDKTVLTDPSVVETTLTDPDNFIVALSAIASNKSITGYSHIPTDTMLVLDISRSMGPNTEQGDDNNDAVDELITAANAAISKLQAVNNYNRVGVVLYSGNYTTSEVADDSASIVLLPLDRYEHSSDTYLVKDEKTFEVGNDDKTAESIMVNSNVTNSDGDTVSVTEREVYGGTYIQSGIYNAMNEFLAVEDTVITGEGFQAGTKRMPITVLMSDGLPTIATSNYTGGTSGIGKSDLGTGNSPTGYLESAIPFVTQLTASYAKEKIEEHYDRTSLFYTLGFKVDDSPVLDPSVEDSDIDDHWTTYNATADGESMQLAVGQRWVQQGRNGYYQTTYKSIAKSRYDLSPDYINQYFRADRSLTAAFDAIVDEIILQSLYYPTYVDNGDNELGGYLEFHDDIGQYMEVKDIKGIRLGGTLYTGEALAQNFREGGGELGTVDSPNEMGNEMIRAVKSRLGIDTATAQDLVNRAYKAGQLSYNDATGEYSTYIGWYSDVDGNFISHGTENDDTVPENAEFYNESYGFTGAVADGYRATDMMYVSVQVHKRLSTGTMGLTFRVPAALIPVVSYNVSLTGESLDDPGEITVELDDTIDVDTVGDGVTDSQVEITPIRLIYELGLRDDVSDITVHELVGEDYKYYDNGTYTFYTNRWNPEDMNHEHPSEAHNTVSFFAPSHENERYYYTENTTVYELVDGEYIPYTGDAAPVYEEGKYFREFIVFEYEGEDEGNAEMKRYHEPIHEKSLGMAKRLEARSDAVPSAWYIPKGTIHRYNADYLLDKADNSTGTIDYAHYPSVEKIEDDPDTEENEEDYYVDMILGNNGLYSFEAAEAIKITKTLDESMEGRTDTFTFNIAGPDGTYRFMKNGAVSEITIEDGNAQFEIVAGDVVYIADIPAGETVTITEVTDGKDYEVKTVNGIDTDSAVITVAEHTLSKAEFVNGLKPPVNYGSLVLHKNVVHPLGDDADPKYHEFTFNVSYIDDGGNTYHTEQVKLRDGENKTFTDIVIPTTVVIEEVDIPDGFTSDKENNTVTTVIDDEKVYIVDYTNTYSPTKVSPVNVTVTGDKTFTGRENDEWLDSDSFTFKLQKREGTEWVDLDTATVDKDNTSFDFSSAIQTETYDAVGTYSYRIIEVFDENPYLGITYDESVRWFDITVTDSDWDAQYEISVVDGFNGAAVTKDGDIWNVHSEFLNTYAPTGSDAVTIVVNKDITDLSGSNAEQSKAGYTFGLYQGETLVATLPATSAAGETLITLNYGATDIGKVIEYTLKEIVPEEKVPGIIYSTEEYAVSVEVMDDTIGGVIAEVTVDGKTGDEVDVTITNTYDPTDAEIVLKATKTLEGRDDVDGEFKFTLVGEGISYEAVNDADLDTDNVVFDKLTFDTVGTYNYTITETDLGAEGMTYDTTVYDVTVTVTDEDGVLKAVAAYAVDGTAKDAVAFTNTYDPADAEIVLKATKTLEGRDDVDGEFKFTLVGEGISYEAVNDADLDTDNVVFDKLTFDTVGTYNYTITETDLGAEGMTYDTTVYDVTVTVTDEDGVLKAVAAYAVDGAAKDAVTFTNEYVPPVTTTEPEPPVTTTEPEPPVTTTEPGPPVTTTEPEPPVTTTEPEPPVTTTEPEPPVTTTESEPPVTTTEPEPDPEVITTPQPESSDSQIKAPQTGDRTTLWITLLVISALGIIALGISGKTKKIQ